jgi:signal transduction histidine kinase/ActR/RegA family two-component response regulator
MPSFLRTPELTRNFILVVLLTTLVVVAAAVGLQQATAARAADSAQVNHSGYQRMLSQRIAWHAAQLLTARDDTSLAVARERLLAAADDMLRTHEALVHGDPTRNLPGATTPALQVFYFEAPYRLDARVRGYTAKARTLATAPAAELTPDNRVLHGIEDEAQSGLLEDLDALVQHFQTQHEGAVLRLQLLQMLSILSLVTLTLVLVGQGLLRPARRRITEAQHQLAERDLALRRSERALATLRASREIIAATTTEQRLLDDICRLIAGSGGYRCAHVGRTDDDPQGAVRTLAQTCPPGTCREVPCASAMEEAPGCGPAAIAVRTGAATIERDIGQSPTRELDAWRKAALARGLRSCIALPLRVDGRTIAALTIFAPEPDAFDPEETRLLSDLADALGHGLDTLHTRAQTERLAEADRRKDAFLATLAHELRNPLTPIRNALALMERGSASAELLAQARQIAQRQLEQLIRLVDDLLDVSRITRNKIELRRERVPLGTVVQAALETSRPQVEAGAHTLRVNMPPGDSLCLDCDATRLAQVIANLIINAAKFTPRDGNIELSARSHEDRVEIQVKDDGIGISREALGTVFDLFSQAHAGPGGSGGLGVGLALVDKLVRLHGGTVWAESAGPGKGSTFTVRLPLPAAARGERHLPVVAAGTAPRGPARRILVVDDNVDAADTTRMLLESCGHHVRTAYGGHQGIAAALAFQPEMVLLDIGMPEMDGHQVARRLRREPSLQGVLLVALTGWGQPQDRDLTREAGFDHHLVKPLDLGQLQEILAEAKEPERTAHATG